MFKIKGYAVLCHGSQSSFGMYCSHAEACAVANRNAHMGAYVKTIYA